MKIISEKNLRCFEAWSGGADTLSALTGKQCDVLEQYLMDLYPDGVEDMVLNDILWHDYEWIAELLGYDSFLDLEEANKELMNN